MKRGIQIDTRDNVGVVIDSVTPGEQILIEDSVITALDTITLPHKIALTDLAPGDYVMKYGDVIGYATCKIRTGQHVHVHNMDSEKMMK